MPKKSELTGKTLGRLKIIKQIPNKTTSNGNSYVYWLCECSCGNFKEIKGAALTNHKEPTLSCGCLQKEKASLLGKSFFKGAGISGVNSLFTRYKRGARYRNLEFKITKDEFREFLFKECYYCGDEPKNNWRREEVNQHLIYNGIDRRNNNIGYLKENLVTCCGICNKAKMDLSDNEFITLAKKISGKHL